MGQYAYIRVLFNGGQRPVYMDGGSSSIGQTNQKLRVRKLYHEFDLGDPNNYQPPMHGLKVKGTTRYPTEIVFDPIDTSEGDEPS